jgi:hypothetical protein
MMSEDVTVAYGRRVSTMRNRVATRQGSEDGSVTLGGRRVPIVRPRMRATDGSGELPIPSYEVFRTEVLGRLAMEKMLAGIRSGGGAAPSSAGTGPGRSAMIRRGTAKVLAFSAADSRSSSSPGVIRPAAKWSRNWAVLRSRSTSETRMRSSISCLRFLG